MTAATTAPAPADGAPVRSAARSVLGLLAGLVRLVTGLFAAVLVVHIVLAVGGANTENAITQFFAGAANALTLGLEDLFVIAGPFWQTIVSYGVPALAWLIIGAIVVKIISLLTPRPRR